MLLDRVKRPVPVAADVHDAKEVRLLDRDTLAASPRAELSREVCLLLVKDAASDLRLPRPDDEDAFSLKEIYHMTITQ